MGRSRSGEDGFTIIELVIVFVIIAVLVGIALPTFLAMRRGSQDAAAKDAAVLALKVARTVTESANDFSEVTAARLNADEPSHTFLDGTVDSTGPHAVSQTVPDAGAGDEIFIAAVKSESGVCFFIRSLMVGATDYGRVEGANCRAGDHGSVVFLPSW